MAGAEPQYVVRLRGDAALLVEQDKYLSELEREYQLLRAGQRDEPAGPTTALLGEVEELLVPFAGVRRGVRAAADAALAAGRRRAVVELSVPAALEQVALRYLDLMRRSWRMSEQGALLTMPPTPELQAFQVHWSQQVAQAVRLAMRYGTGVLLPDTDRLDHEPDIIDEDAEHLLVWFDEPAPAGPGIARQRLAQLLESWGREELSDAAQLAVTELLTNAFLHAPGPVLVHLAPSGPGVRIAVTDTSPAPPVSQEQDVEMSTGRGLALVEAMARAWGHDTRSDGKTVWADFRPASGQFSGLAP